MSGTYAMYCKREPRFYTTVTYNGEWWWTENRKTQFKSKEPDFVRPLLSHTGK